MPLFAFFVIWFYCYIGVYCCSIDSKKLQTVLSDLESKGYEIATGKHVYFANATGYGIIYGMYEIDFFDVNESPFWYIPGESAIIFHGCSPPNSQYFSYRSYIGTTGNVIHPFPINYASMGDSINQLVINYTNNINPNSPFDALITMVTTADKVTYNDIYNSFKSVDLQNTLNLDIIPNKMGNDTFIFGKNPIKSNVFSFTVRIAIPWDIKAYNKYINDVYTIYLVSTSKNVVDKINQFSPRVNYTYPIQRNRTSNINEFELYMDNIFQLTQSVTNYFVETQNMTLIYQTSQSVMDLDGYECVNGSYDCLGDNHDAAYFTTSTEIFEEDFFMRNNKLYIGLGINHNVINQTVYSDLAVYKLENPFFDSFNVDINPNCTDCILYSAIGGITNFDKYFNGSASFFDTNANITHIEAMFVVAFGRPQNCDLYISKANIPCLGFNETILGNNDPFNFAGRAYLNPNTKTGPSYQQIIPDVILEFNIN